MKSTVSLFYLTVFIIIQIQATNLFGCTIFSISDSTHSLMGNSEDYWEEGYMSTIPKNSDGFGRITFSFDDKYTQGGINEYGLAIDGTGAINEMDMTLNPSLPNLSLKENIIEMILKTTSNNTISFKTGDGDYKLIMAKSDNFENPIIYDITFYKDINASMSIFFLIFLILLIPKTKLKLAPVVLLFFLFISCEKDLNSLFVNKMENKNYRVQINAPESGKWYWKIEGKTDSGYTISTKPLCFTIE
jgi:hypothetical protein